MSSRDRKFILNLLLYKSLQTITITTKLMRANPSDDNLNTPANGSKKSKTAIPVLIDSLKTIRVINSNDITVKIGLLVPKIINKEIINNFNSTLSRES